MRKIFINQLTELGKKNKKLFFLTGDLGFNVVEPFQNKFPKRFFNVGVAEQNMVGVAAGLASEGLQVFIYSIANFPTFRCAEQIRNDIDYHNLPVTIVSVGSGVGYGSLGYSHHALQDYALMRIFPNMLIFSPGNNNEVISCLKYITKNPQPSYLRLDKDEVLSKISKKKLIIKPGKIYNILKGLSNKIILTTGNTQDIGIQMSKNKYKGFSVCSIPAWGMKFKKNFIKSIKNISTIVTVEDHFYDGGFGSWVNESIKLKKNNIKIFSEFISDKTIYKVGSKKYLLNKYGPKI